MAAAPPTYRCVDCPDTYWRAPETTCWVCGQVGQPAYLQGVFSGAWTLNHESA